MYMEITERTEIINGVKVTVRQRWSESLQSYVGRRQVWSDSLGTWVGRI